MALWVEQEAGRVPSASLILFILGPSDPAEGATTLPGGCRAGTWVAGYRQVNKLTYGKLEIEQGNGGRDGNDGSLWMQHCLVLINNSVCKSSNSRRRTGLNPNHRKAELGETL